MNPPQLPQRSLGHTGLQISVLALGTVKWGRNQGVKYPAFELPDDATLHQLLDIAEDSGLNILDVAPAYGIAEERVGRLLAERPQSSFLVMSKSGEEFTEGVSRFDYSAAHTEASVHRSLRRLKRETLDVGMVHCSADDLSVLNDTPVLETLYRMRDSGLVRALGVSTMTVAGGLRAAELVDCLMVPYSVGYRDHLPVIQRAAELGKGVLIKRALYSGPYADQKLSLREHLEPVLQCPGVTALVAGTINPAHLRENMAAVQEVLGGGS